MTTTTERPAEMVSAKNAIPLEEAPFTYETLKAIARTEFVPKGLRGNVPAILAAVMVGREMGLPPMEAIRCIDMIDGNPTPSAELLLRLIREKGHRVRLEEQSADKVRITGIRRENPDDAMTVEFTFEMAKRANLATKNNWKNYPEAMLFWRAVTMLARQQFPDAVGAARVSYVPGEVAGDFDGAPPDIPVDVERVDDDEPKISREDTLAEVTALVGPDVDSSRNMPDIEADVRLLYRLMEQSGEWLGAGDDDQLHVDLRSKGVEHVSDLRKAELVAFAEEAWAKARDVLAELPFEDPE
ncbi:MAG TPA: hypothetical protein VIG24_02340 [Acidimicrobiia bacterium]